MARTGTPVVLLDTTVAYATSGTKGAPGAVTPNGFYDNTGNYDSPLGIMIKNGAIGPGSPCVVVVQVADTSDGPWTDFDAVSGDTAGFVAATLAGQVSRTILLTKVRFVKVIAYGNSSQDVYVTARLHAVTGL